MQSSSPKILNDTARPSSTIASAPEQGLLDDSRRYATIHQLFSLNKFPSQKAHLLFSSIGVVNLLVLRAMAELTLFAPVKSQFLLWIYYLSAGLGALVALFCGWPVWRTALKDLTKKIISVEVCVGLALIVAVGGSAWGIYVTPQDYFAQPLYNTPLFFVFGIVVLRYVLTSARQLLTPFIGSSFFERQHLTTLVGNAASQEIAKQESSIEASKVIVDQVIRVKAGEVIPVDGFVVGGGGEVNERRYSGFPILRLKDLGHDVYAGSDLRQGFLDIRVTATANDSELTYFTRILNTAVSSPTRDEKSFSVHQGVCAALIVGSLLAGAAVWFQAHSIFLTLNAVISVLTLLFVPLALSMGFYIKSLAATALFADGALVRTVSVIEKLARAGSFILDAPKKGFPKVPVVQSFDVLDERIDENSIASLLLCLVSGSDDPVHVTIVEHLRPRIKKPIFRSVTEFLQYEKRGVMGTMEGSEFTFGTEAFLLDRGVLFQASDVESPPVGGEYHFLAVGEEVLARVTVSSRPILADSNLPAALRPLNVRPYLLGEAEPKQVDAMGKELGFELSQIYGGIKEKNYTEKVRSLGPSVFFSVDRPNRVDQDPAITRVATFDPATWDASLYDVSLSRWTVELLKTILEIPRRGLKLEAALFYAGCGLSGALYILALSKYASPTVVLGLLAIFTAVAAGAAVVFYRGATKIKLSKPKAA